MKQRGRKPTPAAVKGNSAHAAYGNTLLDQARAQIKAGKLADAQSALTTYVKANPDNAEAGLLLADVLTRLGRRPDAVLALRAVLDRHPKHATTCYRMAMVLKESNREAEAEFAFLDAVSADPNFAEAHLELGNMYSRQGKKDAAEAAYRKTIDARPAYAFGHFNLGNLLRERGRIEEAKACYREAARLKPDYAPAWYNLGIALKALGQNDEAAEAYRQAIAHKPDHVDACNNLGLALRAAGRFEEAEAAFRKGLSIKETAHLHVNLGDLLYERGNMAAAISAMERSLALKPNLGSAARALAQLYSKCEQDEAAEKVLRRFIQACGDDPKGRIAGLEGLAKLLKEQDKFLEAADAFAQILAIEPDDAEAMAGLCHAKASMCDWRGRDEEFARLMKITEKQIEAGERTALTSFSALARPLSPADHLKIGRSWAEDTKRQVEGWRKRLDFRFDRSRRHDRLRIGYVSQDFRNQAMGHLTRTMFGLHDRSEFDIYGYSVRKNDNSIYRKTIEAGCEHFADIDRISAAEGAKRIFGDEIDIMVDLMGFTEGNRMRITALHPAPVTVGFLRFPGSSGADFVDYMLTDPVVTTPEDQPYYSEQLVFLPHCYQPNDWTQEIDESPIARAEFGLPEDAFVFSCFNNHYKLEPFIFDLWMRILKQVPNSVLWILQFNAPMADNLRREAEARGVSAERLIFARKIGKARHLARQKLADLFLDTRYYTSHTTGSDALWGGLPVLTCPSDSFASRVTASLLKAADLPELIVPDFAEYERLAVHLATHPKDLKDIRDKWTGQRTTCPLFDTRRFVKNLEQAYRLIWQDWLDNRPPRQLFVREA